MTDEVQVPLEAPPPVKNRPGRPSRLSKEIAEQICDNIRKGCTKKSAGAMVGVPYPTLATWERKYEWFSAAIKKAWDEQEGRICQCILSWMTQDWKAGAWYLERTRQDRYAIRKTEITQDVLLEYLRKRKEDEEEAKALARPVDK